MAPRYWLHIHNANTFAITDWWNIASCTNRQRNVKRTGKYVFVSRWRLNLKAKENPSKRPETNTQHLPASDTPYFLISPYL